MGDFRYYLVPDGMVTADEVPEGWGLLYAKPRTIRVIKKVYFGYKTNRFGTSHDKNMMAEFMIMYSTLREYGYFKEFIGEEKWKEFKDKKVVSSRIYLLHWEELNKGRMIHWLKNYPWTFIAVDESQRAKRHGNVSSRRIAQLRNSAEYKVILSGTPMDKQQFDLWGQMRFVKPDLFGTNWGDFTNSYLKPTGFELRN